MRFEQMLADALREEADTHHVDVDGLWERTRAGLDERADVARRRLPVLAATAAAVVAVAAGGAALGQLFVQDDPVPVWPTESGEPVEGGVDDEFTCPEQITHDWTRPETVTDDYFVASLRGGPAEQARIRDAARYEYEERGDRAFLRFGNADGSLATLSEFRRDGEEWVRFRTDLCTGEGDSIAVPLDDEWELRPREAENRDTQGGGAAGPSPSLLVDSRTFYDNAGLVRNRTLHAVPCGQRGLCLSSAEDDEESSTSIATLGTGRRLWDLSWIFMPAEERPVSRPYGLWALFDPVPTEYGRLSATLRDGGTVEAEIYDSPNLGGTLYLLLAPFDEVESLTVEYPQPVAGTAPQPETHLPEELGASRADLRP
jgi:hypothetical protein